jgi:hypothetical protein
MEIRRSIMCEECKRPRRTKQWFDVCDTCVRKLPKVRCDACAKSVVKLQPDSPLCRQCTGTFSKQRIVCERCAQTDYPLISDPGLCRRCHKNANLRLWRKSLPQKMVCCDCGLPKRCFSKSEMVCQMCYKKRRNGEVRCTFTGCTKVILNKNLQLCRFHSEDRLAAKRLSKYIKTYASPFPANVRYFFMLTAKVNFANDNTQETTVRLRDVKRYRAIGEYLKIYELPERLTWQAIQEALPNLNSRGRARNRLIRSALLELGNLCFQNGLLPDWNAYLYEQRCDKYLQSAPPMFVDHVAGFEKWASAGMLNPKFDMSLYESQPLTNTSDHILETIKAVVKFLKWCVKRNIHSLADINQNTAASYIETLFWQQECRACRKRIPLDSTKTGEICSNRECQAIDSYVRIRRLARATASRGITTKLRTFFNWAQLHDVVWENPFPYDTVKSPKGTFTVINESGQMIEIADSIRRYDDDVVKRLCSDMVCSDDDPEVALVLYFIVFHLLTVSELCNAKIPSLAAAAEEPPGDCDRAKDFEYVLLPMPKPSRGQRTPRREGPLLKYAKEAAPWLRPLLERHFEKRKLRGGSSSEYLFVNQYHLTRNNRPVGRKYIRRLIERASRRVLNGTVNARDLRGTLAAIVTHRSKRRGAILTKLGYTCLRATRYNHLETFLLAPRTTSTQPRQPPAGA